MLSAARPHLATHPWRLGGASALLTGPCRSALAPQAPARRSASDGTAATDRILLDEHRSDGGSCVRCDTPWPCTVTVKVRTRSAA
ncbi:hypothetical protein OG455_14160 [Kitasatospora sp. NBC_01287]|uniref:hypothetical protein n=1 Tax=Kitasatospora sp. NBC_01287 TaxID=2903573 RepID=UPI002251CDC7|nr:hypothetical protein [Kitasatospora sp. NBC_01287]MCX4746647.1 hypothetical protein [Kitasatospora sp. NBC_01287]